ncbi:hypothetical protein [Nocardia sp. NPDC057353]|uniref:hypothetical protein n=1 Tax=Nocardia sp. NPDC057353 TaxID=3346104 RepID=UPI0036354F67
MMATHGFFNHYDDPDEFWDEEPIVRQPAKGPLPPPTDVSSAPAAVDRPMPAEAGLPTRIDDRADNSPRIGSSSVAMELDADFLPVHIRLAPEWSRSVAHLEVGAELVAAYRGAVSERLDTLHAARRMPTPQEISASAVPDHRTRMMLLLETETWEQYSALTSIMVATGRYEAHGRAVADGRYAVTMSAHGWYLETIEVQAAWGASAHPDRIVDELLFCADGIRSQRTRYTVRGDYSRLTDADLEHHLRDHRRQLLGGLVNNNDR